MTSSPTSEVQNVPDIVVTCHRSPGDKNKQRLSEYAGDRPSTKGENTLAADQEGSGSRPPDVPESPGDLFMSPDVPLQYHYSTSTRTDHESTASDGTVFESPSDSHVVKLPSSWTAAKAQSLQAIEKWGGSIRLTCYLDNKELHDSLHHSAFEAMPCTPGTCGASLLAQPKPVRPPQEGVRDPELVKKMAADFLDQYYTAIKKNGSMLHVQRISEVLKSVEQTATYELTHEELVFGAKTAWRNAERCVGRAQWTRLQVIDARNARTTSEMFEVLCRHLRHANNDGNIRSVITVFPARSNLHGDFRVWNPQLIMYAGYRQPDGAVVGDPARVQFTELCQQLGWKGRRGRFDVLPLLLQADGLDPEVFEIPEDLVLEVQLKHPHYPWFAELGLKWFAVPAVSGMLFDCGGLEFTGCPFSGWYIGTEIGARNLSDTSRYDLLPIVAEKLELDTSNNATLWKDRALVEINLAVLHSYMDAKVTISDHHTMTQSFMYHLRNEHRQRGGCPADWVWIVPPVSGSVCPVFHQEMLRYHLKPSYEYQVEGWKVHRWKDTAERGEKGGKGRFTVLHVVWAVRFLVRTMTSITLRRVKVTILFATESGRSETFALKLRDIFMNAFDVRVMCMENYNVSNLKDESLVLMVASTFGGGDPPENGMRFSYGLFNMIKPRQERKNSSLRSGMLDDIKPSELFPMLRSVQRGKRPLYCVRYAVFALGSSAYANFCDFGRFLDKSMSTLGGRAILDRGEGDEMCGQDVTFQKWSRDALEKACASFGLRDEVISEATGLVLVEDRTWQPGRFRVIVCSEPEVDLCTGLSKSHGKRVSSYRFCERLQLQSPVSERQTILVRLSTQDAEVAASFSPGDHVAVFPTNPPEFVELILSRLDNTVSPDTPLRIEIMRKKKTVFSSINAHEWVTDERLLYPLTLRTAIQQYLDVCFPPSRAFLECLSELATDEVQQYRLKELAKNVREYQRWLNERDPTLAGVLTEFSSVTLPADVVLSQLPLLKPRIYSISSAPGLHFSELHLTVKVVQYTTPSGAQHKGVCSGWLNKVKVGASIPCFVRPAPVFHLPAADDKAPVILIGAGAGIAPFRSFWQKRRVDTWLTPATEGERRWGPMTLYFGCRNRDQDYLHGDEIEQALTDGVLDAVYLALSRQPGKPKTYVQNLLSENGAKIADDILLHKGHIYICGEAAMASGVCQTIENILVEHKNMSAKSAARFVLSSREMGFYHEDIFGSKLESTEVSPSNVDV